MKQPYRTIALVIALAFVAGLFMWLHRSTSESLSIAFEISRARASHAVSGLLSATLLVLMTHHVWVKLWTTSPTKTGDDE